MTRPTFYLRMLLGSALWILGLGLGLLFCLTDAHAGPIMLALTGSIACCQAGRYLCAVRKRGW